MASSADEDGTVVDPDFSPVSSISESEMSYSDMSESEDGPEREFCTREQDVNVTVGNQILYIRPYNMKTCLFLDHEIAMTYKYGEVIKLVVL